MSSLHALRFGAVARAEAKRPTESAASRGAVLLLISNAERESDTQEDAMAGMNTARSRAELGRRVEGLGEWIALAGVVLPLLLIGLLKFTRAEIEALRPLITGTPWLAWLYPALGEAGASYLLGVVEITTGCLFLASQWSWRAGLAAGALGTLTFATTVSILFALPVWEGASGGFPWLNFLGSFLIKDVALLGISVTVLGRSLSSATGSSLFARQAIAR